MSVVLIMRALFLNNPKEIGMLRIHIIAHLKVKPRVRNNRNMKQIGALLF